MSHYFLVHFIKLSLDSSSFNLECYKEAGHMTKLVQHEMFHVGVRVTLTEGSSYLLV